MIDLLNKETFQQKLEINLEEKNYLLEKFYNSDRMSKEGILEEYLSYGEKIRDCVTNTSRLINQAMLTGKWQDRLPLYFLFE